MGTATGIGAHGAPGAAPGARVRGLALVTLAYLVAGAAAVAIAWCFRREHPLMVAGAADLVATLVVFAFSVILANSSCYDPYWSVAPIPLAVYFLVGAPAATPAPRQWLVLGLVSLWGLRLTWNWIRGWPGLHHEDWRYVDIRGWSGRAYWPASFLTIHLMPTVLVFGGLLSVWVAVGVGTAPLGWLDGVAAAVTLGAVLVEATADRQLLAFRRSGPPAGATLDTGLWRLSRHPNYFGEVSFWWGLYLFALAADPGRWWVGIGPVALTALFLGVSIPLIDKRMLARRTGYADRIRRVSRLVPWPPRG